MEIFPITGRIPVWNSLEIYKVLDKFFSINILSNKMVLGDKRTFKVVDVRKHGGCDTKFKGGRFVSRTASGAARKAFNALCRVKKIRGKCTLVVVMKETTKGGAGKQYA